VLTIPVGSTVTVTNQDEATHDWTSRNGVWRSGDLAQGVSYSFTFRTTGTFDYLCERHPHMTGTITVTPG
jgi:plastocyanin